MKLSNFLIFVTMIKAKPEFCTFKHCTGCEIALTSPNTQKFRRFIPTCRNIMRAKDCCQDFMRCDILCGCVPRFRRYYS